MSNGKKKKGATDAPESESVDLTLPDEVKIKRASDDAQDQGAKVTGDQSITVVDVVHGKPVQVYLIEAMCFAPEAAPKGEEGEAGDGTAQLVFVQGAVSSELVPAANAGNKFALQADGTIGYNSRGFDGADNDLVDIVKLVEYNHGEGQSKRDQAREEEAAAEEEKLAEQKKAADEQKKADADAAKAAEKKAA